MPSLLWRLRSVLSIMCFGSQYLCDLGTQELDAFGGDPLWLRFSSGVTEVTDDCQVFWVSVGVLEVESRFAAICAAFRARSS